MAILRPPGMRLLKLEEFTYNIALDDGTNARKEKLPIQHEKFSFTVFIRQKKNDYKYSVSLLDCTSTVPCMFLCKMEGRKISEATEVEERVFLQITPEEKDIDDVISLPTKNKSFQVMTVLIIVFDYHTEGVGRHLNQARLSGTFVDGDVKLVVDGVELPAHRAVLAGCSSVFSTMLTGETFKEAREGRIEVVDFPRLAIEKFLEYLYLDHIEDWEGMEVELLKLAHKYMVRKLRSDCCLKLWSCDSTRALEAMLAAGMTDIIPSTLRRRLSTIVVADLSALHGTEIYSTFRKANPILMDAFIGSALLCNQTTPYRWAWQV